MDEGWPAVPDEALETGGWELVGRSTETVFRLSPAEVVGRTLLYEDPALRERLGTGDVTRFFFATALSFQPSLPPGTAPLIESTVRRQANAAFTDRLRERGFEGISRRDRGKFKTDGGEAASLSTVGARCELDGRRLDVTGWLAVWHDDGFLLAGGAYPKSGADIDSDEREEYRETLLSLMSAVE